MMQVNVSGNTVSETRRASSIKAIKKWINNNEHVSARCDESFILQWLAVSDYDIDQTKKGITKYNERRRALPKWFAPVDDDTVRGIVSEQKSVYSAPLSLAEDRTFLCILLGNCDFQKYSLNQLTNVAISCAESSTSAVRNLAIGKEVIFDFSGISLHTASYLTPQYTWNLADLFLNALPMKISRIHLMNGPFWMSPFLFTAMQVTKMFFEEKVIFNHGSDLKTFREMIPVKYLPLEYGGEAGSYKNFADETMLLWGRKPY